jgi:hypothetical protein
LRAKSFTLDGEAVVCGSDGVAIFDALHRRGTVTEAMLYAFDLLELDGEDLRGLTLADRKERLARPPWLGAKARKQVVQNAPPEKRIGPARAPLVSSGTPTDRPLPTSTAATAMPRYAKRRC